ncbi:MAG: c-type cytochrome, partial [Verrucomicrobiales bacterium]|nr:c-type cytochrome [Verrucomicrobiales bacterium]
VEPEKSIVEKISGAMNRLGRAHPELSLVLNQSLGIGPPTEKYDRERGAEIVRAVTAGQGDPETGKAVYALAQLNCIGCHQINDVGGTIGPALDAVGAGLPLDQIVDSLLYPKRQLKEGYFATAITTVDELVHTGYVENEDGANIWIRDIATNKVRPVSRHQILKRDPIGTLMPPGLTASISEDQLIDLVSYLASLKGRDPK